MFFNVVCVSWKLKCWILLMHGVTMKFILFGILSVFNNFHSIHSFSAPVPAAARSKA